ncbi:MAG: hypothetical protein CO189_05550 [candidate division Zixibacteria bacterium CG_4_9_14_3_um_filter_46_8]|nr:MAG: hypothetical protein CO189_05550 [candidate division Zixibacteria bacterium CG_4_9_14_3_um_filter_46_8]
MAKKAFIKRMFSEISGEYDRLNRIISWNLDLRWRRQAVTYLGAHYRVMDICAGTGDMALVLSENKIAPLQVVLVDLSLEMLLLAKYKLSKGRNGTEFLFVQADGENLPFRNEAFGAVTMGFGLRNIEDIQRFMVELARATDANSEMVFLDIAHPESKIVSKLFYIYFYRFVPFFTKFITGKDYAYRYLPASLRVFYTQKQFVEKLRRCGFENVCYMNILTGIGAIYYIKK